MRDDDAMNALRRVRLLAPLATLQRARWRTTSRPILTHTYAEHDATRGWACRVGVMLACSVAGISVAGGRNALGFARGSCESCDQPATTSCVAPLCIRCERLRRRRTESWRSLANAPQVGAGNHTAGQGRRKERVETRPIPPRTAQVRNVTPMRPQRIG